MYWIDALKRGMLPAIRQHAGGTEAYLHALRVLADGLEKNDPLLIQGVTVRPSCFNPDSEFNKLCAGCMVTYAAWKGGLLKDDSTQAAEEFFADVCNTMDELLGETGTCRYVLNTFDEAPRDEAFAMFAKQLRRELSLWQ